jgi:anaerobic C4-dicarboxylate transporter DcuA
MWIIELLVVLFFIWLGARLGSIGIGFAGGFGVLVLALGFGIKPGSIPVDVILIIMSVIAAIAAMQVAGGLDLWSTWPKRCCAAIPSTSPLSHRW